MTFAILASAIISGSLVERIQIRAYVLLVALWSLDPAADSAKLGWNLKMGPYYRIVVYQGPPFRFHLSLLECT